MMSVLQTYQQRGQTRQKEGLIYHLNISVETCIDSPFNIDHVYLTSGEIHFTREPQEFEIHFPQKQ